jgi:hypothetical protein
MKEVVAKKGVLSTYEEPTSTCLLKKRMNAVVAKKGVLSMKLRTCLFVEKEDE